jgi:nucleotide-binding universal stress UspA family protein
MVKHIAIALDSSACAEAAQKLGIDLARRLESCVHGIYVVDSTFVDGAMMTDISGAMGIEPFLNVQAQMSKALEQLGAAIANRFADEARAAGVPYDFRLERSTVASGILDACKLSDILIVGQRGTNARYREDALGSVPAALLRRSPVPVLVVPEKAGLPVRPVVAYDGSPKAIAALHSGAEVARALGAPLTVVTVGEKEERAREVLDEAASYLAPFGIEASGRFERGEAVERVLLGLLGKGEFDLIFLGAHGHGRIVELVLGSTTEHLARHSPVSLFCVTHQ